MYTTFVVFFPFFPPHFCIFYAYFAHFSLPISEISKQAGWLGGILLPLQISRGSLRPTRHERLKRNLKETSRNLSLSARRRDENSVTDQRQD